MAGHAGQGRKRGDVGNAHAQSSDRERDQLQRTCETEQAPVGGRRETLPESGETEVMELIRGCSGQRVLVARAAKGAERVPVTRGTEAVTSLSYTHL